MQIKMAKGHNISPKQRAWRDLNLDETYQCLLDGWVVFFKLEAEHVDIGDLDDINDDFGEVSIWAWVKILGDRIVGRVSPYHELKSPPTMWPVATIKDFVGWILQELVEPEQSI